MANRPCWAARTHRRGWHGRLAPLLVVFLVVALVSSLTSSARAQQGRPDAAAVSKKKIVYLREATGAEVPRVLARLDESIPKDVILLNPSDFRAALATKGREGRLGPSYENPRERADLLDQMRRAGRDVDADAVVLVLVNGAPTRSTVRIVALSVKEEVPPLDQLVTLELESGSDGNQLQGIVGPMLERFVGTAPPEPALPRQAPATSTTQLAPGEATRPAPGEATPKEPEPEPAGGADKRDPGGYFYGARANEHGRFTISRGRGFTFSTEDGAYSLRISARIQLGVATLEYFPQNGQTRLFSDIDRARLLLSGTVYSREIFYLFQLGFGVLDVETAPTPLINASLDFRQIPSANLKVGIIDHHQLVSSSANNQLTMYSPAHYEYNIHRDIGVQVHSEKPFGIDRLKYVLEVAGGRGLALNELAQPIGASAPAGVLYYARIGVDPLGPFDSSILGDLKRSKSPHLALGAGVAYNKNAIYQLSTGQVAGMTQYLAPFDYQHGFSNMAFKWYGFSVVSEAIYRRATERSHFVPAANVVEYSRNGWGWYAQAGMMLTSHIEVASRVGATYQIARPAALGPPTGQAVGVGYVATTVQDVRDLREFVVGASYYIDGHAFKIQADYVSTFLDDLTAWTREARCVLTYNL